MVNIRAYVGVVTEINYLMTEKREFAGCFKIFFVNEKNQGMTNFIITPTTYFLNCEKIEVGDSINLFVDADAPVPLIYPPRFEALVVSKENPNQNITMDFFNTYLVNKAGTLKLNIGNDTEILIRNGQSFYGNPGNHLLVVIYKETTKSIPAQTTPEQIVVMCM